MRIVARSRDNWKHHKIYEKNHNFLYQPEPELTKFHWIFPSKVTVKHVNWRNAAREWSFLPLRAPSAHSADYVWYWYVNASYVPLVMNRASNTAGRGTSERGWHRTRPQYLSFMSPSRTDNPLYPCFNSFLKVWETTEKVNSKVIKTCIAYFIIMGGWEFFRQNTFSLGNACALKRKMSAANSPFSQINNFQTLFKKFSKYPILTFLI